MATRKRNILANRTASVSVARRGFMIEISSVPAADAALVGAELLNAVRGLIAAGYDELVEEAGNYHSTPIDQAEEGEDAVFTLPPHSRRCIGFTVHAKG